MKLFIASDIHGSAYFAGLMVKAFEDSGANRLVLLGDILYHGPRNDLPRDYAPKKVIELLNPKADRIIAVKGNCESEVDQMVLNFPVTSDYGVIFDGSNTLCLSHGHRAIPPMTPGTVYLTGHTHVPKQTVENGIMFLNPGSVSIPKENSPHSYMLYENGAFTWMNLETNTPYKV
ncbi:MAG: phosphodiesterase [Ruminococcaceae bacterium]|nr:phosphodiesterase [Oscillospiraceae bacterium]